MQQFTRQNISKTIEDTNFNKSQKSITNAPIYLARERNSKLPKFFRKSNLIERNSKLSKLKLIFNFVGRKKLFFIGIFIAVFAAFFDLLSKKIVFSILENIAFEQQTNNPQIEIFGFFNLAYVWNRGVSFGMFNQLENSQIIFSATQSLIFLIVAFWLYRNQKPLLACALGLVMGGALGNVIDRVQNGAVADFLDFHVANYHWPAFNLADSWVFIGVMILIFDDLVFKKK